MENANNVAKGIVKTSVGYMMFTAIFGIVLGLVMLFYPGGTMALMSAAFIVFQIILSVFIIYYTLTEAIHYFKTHHLFAGIFYSLIGAVAFVFVWIFDVGVLFYIVAFFLVLTGLADIIGAFRLPAGKGFLILLGIINILIAIIIVRNPVILPLLIAWYVLFWGISRLFLSIELRNLLK